MTSRLKKITLYLLSLVFGMTAVCGFADIDTGKISAKLSLKQEQTQEDKNVWPLIIKIFNEEKFLIKFPDDPKIFESPHSLAMMFSNDKDEKYLLNTLRVNKRTQDADQIIEECIKKALSGKLNDQKGQSLGKVEMISKKIETEMYGKVLTINAKLTDSSEKQSYFIKSKFVITQNNVYSLWVCETNESNTNQFIDSFALDNLYE
jgi:hypothetical protein